MNYIVYTRASRAFLAATGGIWNSRPDNVVSASSVNLF